MKRLIAVLVAAMFAATSFAALAQDKNMDKKAKSSSMEKKSGGMEKKADAKKGEGKKKSDGKKKAEK